MIKTSKRWNSRAVITMNEHLKYKFLFTNEMKCRKIGSHWYFSLDMGHCKRVSKIFPFIYFSFSLSLCLSLFIVTTRQLKYLKKMEIFVQNNNPLYGYFITNLFSHTRTNSEMLHAISHIKHICRKLSIRIQQQKQQRQQQKNKIK